MGKKAKYVSKLLSYILTVCLIMGAVPATTFAQDSTQVTQAKTKKKKTVQMIEAKKPESKKTMQVTDVKTQKTEEVEVEKPKKEEKKEEKPTETTTQPTTQTLTQEQQIATINEIGQTGVVPSHICNGTHDASWTELIKEKVNSPLTGGSYYLGEGGLTLDKSLRINGDVTLCLNGQKLTLSTADENSSVISIEDGAALTLFDREGNSGTISGGKRSGIQIYQGATFIMNGGTISGNSSKHNAGGGVFVEFHKDLDAKYSTFIMNDGIISNNSSGYHAGGVFIGGGNKFTMTGGTISDNSANDGGGVFVDVDSEFTMTGGTISDNSTILSGGGVHVNNGTFTMNDGTISSNSAGNSFDGHGGGVYVSRHTFNMTGGTISDNSAAHGGGIFVADATFNMTGGTISGNSANHINYSNSFDGNGGGVYVGGTTGSTINISGTSIVTENFVLKSKDGTSKVTNNVYLSIDDIINVTDKLPNAVIGVSCSNLPAEGKRKAVATGDGYTLTVDDAEKFISDDPQYTTILDGNTIYLQKGATVQFESNGGSAVPNQSIAIGGKVKQPNVSKPSYIFDGWYKEAELINQWDFDNDTVTGNITLYAKWRESSGDTDITTHIKVCNNDHTGWTILTEDVAKNPLTEGLYYLAYDITIDKEINFTENATLCLYGHTVTLSDKAPSDTPVISVTGNNTELTLFDNADNSGKITGGNDGGICFDDDNTFTMYGGSISNNDFKFIYDKNYRPVPNGSGGGIHFKSGGTFTMYDGSISNNTPNDGAGGIDFAENGTFTMYGGTISDNKDGWKSDANAVDFAENGTFTMNGGTISNNKGSGVIFAENGTFTMNDGTISRNSSSYVLHDKAGGVTFAENGTFTMNDGTISNNSGSGSGGVYFAENATFNLYNGTISGNGSGGITFESGTFTMHNGLISNNSDVMGSGGVRSKNGTFIMNDGAISDNSASGGGGVNASTFIMNGGAISNNSTTSSVSASITLGGGVVAGTFIMNDGTISGNYADAGAGVFIEDSFTMNGGSISGNSAYYIGQGGGVFFSGDTFTMTGGSISDNSAAYGGVGGGVYIENYSTSFTMTGGSISGNSAAYGGGVYAKGTFNISGNPNITGNFIAENKKKSSGTDSNVYLGDLSINVIGELGEDAAIGFTISQPPKKGKRRIIAEGDPLIVDDLAKFTSDEGYTTLFEDHTIYIGAGDSTTSSKFTVTFDSQGGSAITSQSIAKDGKATKPIDPTKDGYTFDGWYKEAACTTAWNFDSDTVTENITLYAKWTEKKAEQPSNPTPIPPSRPGPITPTPTNYTVTFDTNGGSEIASQTVESGKTATMPDDPTRSGYTFLGWFADKEFNDVYRFSTPVTEDVTIYAKWKKKSSSSSSGGGGGGGGSSSSNRKKDTGRTGTWVTEEPKTQIVTQPIAQPTPQYQVTNPSCPRDETCPLSKFTDVDKWAWYHDSSHYCVENGLIVGTGNTTFSPNMPITRGMVVAILWRMEGKPLVNDVITFQDVKETAYYAEAVRWAAHNGIVSGYNHTKFAPNDNITREQMASILYRYAQHKGNDVSGRADIAKYKDKDDISKYAVAAIQWACDAGIINGVSATALSPKGTTTRAQAAQMFYQYLNK